MTGPRTITIFAIGLIATIAHSQTPDRVWLQPLAPTGVESDWYPRSITTVEGNVIDFDHEQIRIIVTGDEAETITSARRVIWIEPGAVSPAQSEAIRKFESGQFAEALSDLPMLLKQRPPVWRQQWLTMMAANAAWRVGRADISLELVSQLDRRSLPPLVTAWLPIAWKNGAQPAAVIQAAKTRLADPSTAVQLVSASWLLSSAHRDEAVAVAKALASQTDRADISILATCLLWRTATPPEVAKSAQQWQKALAKIPMVWQVGPTVTLADKFNTTGQTDAAKHLEWSLELTPIHPLSAALIEPK